MSTELTILDDRYRLEERLGTGAQGETWAAVDLVTQQPVAIKLLEAGLGRDEARLLGEYQQLASLRHPHLLTVYAVGRVAAGPLVGRVYFVAERLVTTSLTATALPDLLAIGRAVASALAVLHAAGIEHRDVKPENIGRAQDGTVRLFDLGLAATRQTPPDRAGSLPYAAPERFVGQSDARADLYSLGAMVIGVYAGRPPLWRGRPLWLVPEGEVRDVIGELLAGCPEPLVNLVASCVARDPQARPQDAEEVAASLARLVGQAYTPVRRSRRPPLVGRGAALAAARAAVDLVAGSEVVLEAAPGDGVRRFLDELALSLRIEALGAGRAIAWHEWAGPERAEGESLAEVDVRRRQAASSAWQRLRQPGTIVCIGPRAPDELAELARRGGLRPATTILLREPTAEPPSSGTIRLPRLDATEAATLITACSSLRAAAAAPLIARADGRAATLVALTRRVEAQLPEPERAQPHAVVAALRSAEDAALPIAGSDDEALLFVTSIARAEVLFTALATALAWPLARVVDGVMALQRRGFIGIRHGAAIGLRLDAFELLRQRHSIRTLAAALRERASLADSMAQAALALTCDDAAGAGQILLREPSTARSWETLARAALAGHDSVPLRTKLVAQLLLQSRYTDALALLPDDVATPTPLRLLRAEIVLRLARPAEALALLEGVADEAAAALRGRAHFQRGDWESAEAEVSHAAVVPAAIETRALAQIYQGNYLAANASVARLVELAETAASRARARSIQGMIAHLRGELATAEACFKQALELAVGQGDLHSEAVYTANLAAARREMGFYAEAVLPTERALVLLRGFGRPGELALALLNAANLELSLGDLDRAGQLAADAQGVAERAGDTRAVALATNLAGDLAARRGLFADAQARYETALAALTTPADRLVVAANLVDIAIEERDQLPSALARVLEIVPASAVGRLRLARARALAVLNGLPGDARELEAQLDDAVAEVAREGRLADRLRGQLAAARLAIHRGEATVSRTRLLDALTTWEQIVTHIPKARLADASNDPDVVKLTRLTALVPVPATPPVLTTTSTTTSATPAGATPSEPAVTRLLEIVKRLNSELRLELLLEFILDAAIELVSAERGFLLLDDGSGKLQIATARNLDRDDLLHGPAEYSRSIAERAAHDREVIVSLDAVEDRRFESSRSVAALQVRSVLAMPLESRSRLLGCIYLDHRLRTRAFTDAEVALVRGLADHAAVAIENARQREEVSRLATELSSRVSVQDEELSALRREVRQGRAALELRYNYDNLVGRSPAMLELFRLLDRVTDTALPVVIYGESGTGKELVARAIHHNGSRATRPFVSESCAAIPDTLLESILFGHVRGAFTGADTERRGLFEVASGGTLFLDEVGEMSPSMQSKLLRVLQQGEVRRVGSERVVKVDVRIVVASNRDLSQLVQSGAFREDLFYRLNVVRVALPALRQRSEDIPLLVDHFLRKLAKANGQEPRRVARSAMDRLVTYQWPGNVRELENEILRAAALGGELLSLGDLSPHIAAGSSAADVSANATFDLKERVERLEKALLREALDRSGGNQSKAAEMLGLSRFGLTKKIKRYRLST